MGLLLTVECSGYQTSGERLVEVGAARVIALAASLEHGSEVPDFDLAHVFNC
jgi:hypothetical protein